MEIKTISNQLPGIGKQVQQPVEGKEVKEVKEEKNEQKEKVHKKEQVVQQIDHLNDFIMPVKTNLKFQLHDKLNEFYVQIVDSTSDEVIREIPSKDFLDRYAATAELLGFMVDQKI